MLWNNFVNIQCSNRVRPSVHGNRNKLLKIAHLNAQSAKCRHHFIEIKGTAEKKEFDILSLSETWFNASNVGIEIEGHKVFRLDRTGKPGGSVCAHIKNALKAHVIMDLSGISESGLHQLWVQVQTRASAQYLFVLSTDRRLPGN